MTPAGPEQPETTLFVVGDSLTEHGTWPEMLAARTGWSVVREAAAGQTSTEIALRLGARTIEFVRSGERVEGTTPLTPMDLRGDFRAFVDAGMADIEVPGVLGGTRGVLAHRVSAAADDGWSFRSDLPLPSAVPATLPFRAAPPSLPSPAVVVLWCGRNNPGPTVRGDIDAMVEALRSIDPEVRFVALGVHTAAFEPEGSGGSAIIGEVNAALAEGYGDRFLDVRAALAAAVRTDDGTPAIDLRADDVHLNAAGDEVIAEAILARLADLGWWPCATPSDA